jgi:hypothetical protein
VVVSSYSCGWSGDHSSTSPRPASGTVVTVGPAVTGGRVWVTDAMTFSRPVSTVSSRAGLRLRRELSIVHWTSTRRLGDSTSTGRAYTSAR